MAILLLAEALWRRKILRGEYQRKFVHVFAVSFIAFWPWLISWTAIRWLGIAMVGVMIFNRYFKVLNFLGGVERISYGDILLALAITACAFLTDQKIFFAIAILEVALADGLAAAIGIKYGKRWHYRILGQTKTVTGSMAVWIISLCVVGAGGLFAHDLIPFAGYAALTIGLPPVLTVAENFAIRGLDNFVIPLLVLGALDLVQKF